MTNIFKQFWIALLAKINYLKNAFRKMPADTHEQQYDDIHTLNWLAIAANKLTNLSCNEATFDVSSDSDNANPLKSLVKDTEKHRFDIVNGMLADGDYFVFPSTDSAGNIYHSYLSADLVRITATDGEKVTEAYAIIDYVQPNKDRTTAFFLLRHHKLDGDTLTVSYTVQDQNGNQAQTDYWSDLQSTEIRYTGAVNIGFGRYKSPKDSRGLSPIYGVPLNFGCCDIENKVNETIAQIEYEYRNSQSKIFTDPRNVQEGNNGYKFAENIFPIKRNSGDNAPQIEIFNPAIRSSEHWEKLQQYLALYEQSIGVSRGIFTDNSATDTATATAVRRSNSDTMAMINSIHNAIDDGNMMLLDADAMYLQIRGDIWQYKSDYYDPFSDPTEQWQMLLQAQQAGAAEAEDLIRWVNPSLSEAEIADKVSRISAATQDSQQSAIIRALNM